MSPEAWPVSATGRMRGGFEYWVREGFAYTTAHGPAARTPDPLTAPVTTCGC